MGCINCFNTQDNPLCQKAKALMEQNLLPTTEKEVANYYTQLKAITKQSIEQYKIQKETKQFLAQEQKAAALRKTITNIKEATTKYLYWMDQYAREMRLKKKFLTKQKQHFRLQG